jgi:hypothetical protein
MLPAFLFTTSDQDKISTIRPSQKRKAYPSPRLLLGRPKSLFRYKLVEAMRGLGILRFAVLLEDLT